MFELRARSRRRLSSLSLLVVGAVASVAGCSSAEPIDVLSAPGWPGALSDSDNSSYAAVTGPRDPTPQWSRPLGASTSTHASIAANGQITVTLGDGTAGCSIASFESDSGRKRFCNPLGPAAVSSTAVADAVANLYVGDDGGIGSINEHGQQRWRTPVYGVPRAPQFLPDGNVLVVTQFGQVNVLSSQTGRPVAATHDLIPPPSLLESPNTPLRSAEDGLGACVSGGEACAVPAAPAVDIDASDFYVVLWRSGAIAPQLVALHYVGGDSPAITEKWSSALLPAAVTSSPVLSADGRSIYVTDADGTVRAFDTEAGSPKWAYFVGHHATGSPAVTPDGVIVPSGGDGAHVLALRDGGDRPEVLWERPDLVQLGAPALTEGGVGYTVTGTSDDPALLTFDVSNGDTLDTDDLPGAQGYSTGVSVGPDGRILVTMALGELFLFR